MRLRDDFGGWITCVLETSPDIVVGNKSKNIKIANTALRSVLAGHLSFATS